MWGADECEDEVGSGCSEQICALAVKEEDFTGRLVSRLVEV